jgi:ribosomal protein S1
MSTPETPPQNSTPDVSDPGTPPDTNVSAPPVQPMSNGHVEPSSTVETPPSADPSAETASNASSAQGAGGASEGHEEEGSEDEHAGANASEDSAPRGENASADNAAGDKKRRRRRRKKKPGIGASGQAAPGVGDPSPPEGAHEAESAEEPGEPHEGHAEGQSAANARPRRKERRPGPSRERPPVNAGDIVFGKIIEITDDAILIDIPGKAHAIFDRREMLLLDDDDAAAAPRHPGPAAPGTEAAASDAEAVPTLEVSEGAPFVAGESQAAPAPDTAPDPASVPPDAPLSVAQGAQVVQAEPPKEPKVPRVILEVGADFIGVVYNDGARGGLVVLTHHPHRAEKAKHFVEAAFTDKTPIEGLVTGVIKGGIEVDIDGLRAFAPGSHVELRLGTDLSHLVAKRLPFFVTQYAKRGRDVVLSRRSMLEEEAKRARTDALSKLKIGEEVDGTVRSVVPFGAFVDVGGVEGLVPLQEMSHNRADGPSDVFKAGEPTRVKVIKIDDKGKIWLSHKATVPDPWQQVAQKYAAGTRHVGKVVRLQPFGAFVELESGVDGLIHLADLSIRRIEAPEEVVKVGDSIDVLVAHVDPSNHKIALHPAPQGDAANEAPQRVAAHKAIKAKVVTIEAGGLVVRILGVTGRNARGYVTGAGTGTPRGTELRKSFTIGQEIDAKVIEVDPRRGEVKLSIKALSEDQERNAYQQYRQQLKAEARFTFGDLLAKKGLGNK